MFIGNRGALYYKEKNMIKEKDKLTENEYAYADEMVFSRIRSHVMNEVEEAKYKQLEFDFEEDQVAPI